MKMYQNTVTKLFLLSATVIALIVGSDKLNDEKIKLTGRLKFDMKCPSNDTVGFIPIDAQGKLDWTTARRKTLGHDGEYNFEGLTTGEYAVRLNVANGGMRSVYEAVEGKGPYKIKLTGDATVNINCADRLEGESPCMITGSIGDSGWGGEVGLRKLPKKRKRKVMARWGSKIKSTTEEKQTLKITGALKFDNKSSFRDAVLFKRFEPGQDPGIWPSTGSDGFFSKFLEENGEYVFERMPAGVYALRLVVGSGLWHSLYQAETPGKGIYKMSLKEDATVNISCADHFDETTPCKVHIQSARVSSVTPIHLRKMAPNKLVLKFGFK